MILFVLVGKGSTLVASNFVLKFIMFLTPKLFSKYLVVDLLLSKILGADGILVDL